MDNLSDKNSWFSIRRKLASALKNSEELTLPDFRKFLDEKIEYIPLFEDIVKFSSDFSLAEISEKNGNLVFKSGKVSPGNFKFDSSAYSSVTELLLYILPALVSAGGESTVEISGATNSSLSYPAVSVKDVILRNFEKNGIKIDINTSKLGFYARGGGLVKAAVSGSLEKKPLKETADESVSSKIIISGSDTRLALYERDLMEGAFPELLGSGIMEVDSDALGNWIYLYFESPARPMFFFREIPFYNSAGDMIFDYEGIEAIVEGLRAEYDGFIKSGILPYDVDAERAVFL